MLSTQPASHATGTSDPSVDTLEQELTTLAAHLNAGNYRFLQLLAEFERRGGHVGWGIVSCAHWLQWKCGIGLVAGREKVRVARALQGLPKLSESMRLGRLSYCKVRALTRIATKENEDFLVQVGETGTVSHVEKMVRLYRKTDRGKELAEANELRAGRELRCYFDETGALVVQGRLDPEQGALVMNALQAARDALRQAEQPAPDASRGGSAQGGHASREAQAEPDRPDDAYLAGMADALGLVCESFLAHGMAPLAAGDRHLVTVHVDERVLCDETEEGKSHVEDGPCLPPTALRRLCCDASLVAIVQRSDGSVLDVGRKTRAIPPALRRALEARDQGCRYPGCTNTRFVDGHHIQHWINGGETKLSNLVALCRRHHRFVHEHGFSVERVGDRLRFRRPDGMVVPDVPAHEGIEARAGMDALVQAHTRDGLVIEARTGVPKWFGERMDYGDAVGALQDRATRAKAPAN
jgi:hypothetical protein